MEIKEVKGNLLEASEDLICHQVNCQGRMGSGVALAIKEKYPQVYKQYKTMCKLTNPLGEAQAIQVSEKQIVINMYAQEFYGYDKKQYTSYEAFEKCCKKIRDIAIQFNLSVAMPYKIGSVRGGAEWDEIYKILVKYFGPLSKVNLTLYKL
jgi:O-acetyl-ADP-ribose deacetylase (regulator of RNase III)